MPRELSGQRLPLGTPYWCEFAEKLAHVSIRQRPHCPHVGEFFRKLAPTALGPSECRCYRIWPVAVIARYLRLSGIPRRRVSPQTCTTAARSHTVLAIRQCHTHPL